MDVTEDIYVRDYLKLFLNEMNKLSKELDLRNTNFANPHGLQNNYNKSSSWDLGRLTYHAIKYEEFRKIVVTRKHKAFLKYVEDNEEVTESQIIWENTNKLLDKGFSGVKTGITKPAGACLSSWYNVFVEDIKS